MGNATNFTDLILLHHFLSDLLEQQLVFVNHFLFHLLTKKSLDHYHSASQLLQRNIFACHYSADRVLRGMLSFICKNWHIVLHCVNDPHIHATHVLLKTTDLRRFAMFALTRYRLAAS